MSRESVDAESYRQQVTRGHAPRVTMFGLLLVMTASDHRAHVHVAG